MDKPKTDQAVIEAIETRTPIKGAEVKGTVMLETPSCDVTRLTGAYSISKAYETPVVNSNWGLAKYPFRNTRGELDANINETYRAVILDNMVNNIDYGLGFSDYQHRMVKLYRSEAGWIRMGGGSYDGVSPADI